jgi:hypothetical protein
MDFSRQVVDINVGSGEHRIAHISSTMPLPELAYPPDGAFALRAAVARTFFVNLTGFAQPTDGVT